jgi:hypothetical protein
MERFIHYYKKVELFFGNMKFAVFIIMVFAVTLGYGTFMESYHGTEYANRLIYKSLPFMGIQFLMFLSILFATLIRLPPKKHLYGFYVIHAGLITIFLGSYITYHSGVDGTLTLAPNLPTRQIDLSDDEFRIEFPSRGKQVSVALPYVSSTKDLKMDYEGIKLQRFVPFAENELQWLPVKVQNQRHTSGRYRIANQNFGEFITLSLHPDSDFNNTIQMGLLNVHYMPSTLAHCFGKNTPDGLIVWSGEDGECISPESGEIRKKKLLTGKNVAQVEFKNQKILFMPELSPLPLNESLEMNESSPFRIFAKKLFEKSPHLFVFGKSVAFFDKETQKWVEKSFEKNGQVELPWMGFKLTLLEHREDAYPTMAPVAVTPVQENSQVIKGTIKAVEVSVDGQTFWVRSGEPVSFTRKDEKVQFELTKKTLTLPYELVLDQFKMDTDPGTATPASFESFVTLFKGTAGSEKHHIFMNNPLKHQNFTFYQASYFQTQQGPFGSVLSVNFDPGRFWKYLGSFLLVFGSIWHFVLRRKHLTKPGATRA